MAGGYACDFCDGQQPAAWLITNLATGATFSPCADDAPVMLIPLLAGMLGLDGPKLYEAIQRETSRQAKAAAKEAVQATEAAQAEPDKAAGGGVTLPSGEGDGPGNDPDTPAVTPATGEAAG
jgi:hypothetical protein